MYKLEMRNKTLIALLILSITFLIVHVLGALYFFGRLGSLTTDFESYIGWIILTSLLEVFIILNLSYLILKNKYFNKPNSIYDSEKIIS